MGDCRQYFLSEEWPCEFDALFARARTIIFEPGTTLRISHAHTEQLIIEQLIIEPLRLTYCIRHGKEIIFKQINGSNFLKNLDRNLAKWGLRLDPLYNINYHKDIRDYINEGYAKTPVQILFDPVNISNPLICICYIPLFLINCDNGCNNGNNSRCFNHTLVICNSLNCDKVFHFGWIENLLHDAEAINNYYDIRNTY